MGEALRHAPKKTLNMTQRHHGRVWQETYVKPGNGNHQKRVQSHLSRGFTSAQRLCWWAFYTRVTRNTNQRTWYTNLRCGQGSSSQFTTYTFVSKRISKHRIPHGRTFQSPPDRFQRRNIHCQSGLITPFVKQSAPKCGTPNDVKARSILLPARVGCMTIKLDGEPNTATKHNMVLQRTEG